MGQLLCVEFAKEPTECHRFARRSLGYELQAHGFAPRRFYFGRHASNCKGRRAHSDTLTNVAVHALEIPLGSNEPALVRARVSSCLGERERQREREEEGGRECVGAANCGRGRRRAAERERGRTPET